MRVSTNERVILSLLVIHGAIYGLQLVDASGNRLKRGGIYVTLGSMELKGLVTSELQGDGWRVYQLAGIGHRALAAMEIMNAIGEAE